MVPWPVQPGVLGVASPDVVRVRGGRFVVTYQSDPGGSPPRSTQARLFYRTSADLQHWSPPRPLAQQLAPRAGDRMIDGALVVTGHQLLVGFKFSSPTQPDVFEIARSTTGQLRGPWVLVGRPDITVVGGTVENYEFVRLAARWRLLATSDNLDQPWLFTLAGDPDRAQGWLQWTRGYQLERAGPGLQLRAGDLERGLRARQLGLPVQHQLVPGSRASTSSTPEAGAHPVRRMGPRRHRCGPEQGPGPLAGPPG